MIFDWNLRSRKDRTNANLIGAISPKKPFSSIMRYIVLWRHLWRYRINANIKTWYPQKPHILTFTLIPSSFFSDHCVKLYRWMCITFQMPLVFRRGSYFKVAVANLKVEVAMKSFLVYWKDLLFLMKVGGFKSRMCPPYPHACRKKVTKMGHRNIAQVADTALSTNLT